MNHIGLGVPLPDTEQVQLFSQKIYLILLLWCKLVMRPLYKFQLLSDNVQLALLLLSLLLERSGFVGSRFELRFTRDVLGV